MIALLQAAPARKDSAGLARARVLRQHENATLTCAVAARPPRYALGPLVAALMSQRWRLVMTAAKT